MQVHQEYILFMNKILEQLIKKNEGLVAIHCKLCRTTKIVMHRQKRKLSQQFSEPNAFMSIGFNEHTQLNSSFNKSLISSPLHIKKFFFASKSTTSNLNIQPAKACQSWASFITSHLSHSKPEFAENSLIHQVYFVLLNLSIIETCL